MTPPDPAHADNDPDARQQTATLSQVALAVFWSFFGVRKGRDMQNDTVTIKPLHIVVVGLLSGLAFVLALVALVTLITRLA
jgi:uncharacterized transporter YbjL